MSYSEGMVPGQDLRLSGSRASFWEDYQTWKQEESSRWGAKAALATPLHPITTCIGLSLEWILTEDVSIEHSSSVAATVTFCICIIIPSGTVPIPFIIMHRSILMAMNCMRWGPLNSHSCIFSPSFQVEYQAVTFTGFTVNFMIKPCRYRKWEGCITFPPQFSQLFPQ